MARIRKPHTDESYNSKKVIWHIALYIRLSRDDGNDESLSVTNQRKILTEYVEQFFQGEYVVVDEYVDDADIVRLTGKPLQSGGYRVSLIFSHA